MQHLVIFFTFDDFYAFKKIRRKLALDNLAHDKIMRCHRTKSLLQAEVRKPIDCHSELTNGTRKAGRTICANTSPTECFEPISDPLLASVVAAVPSYAPNIPGTCKWIPTVACGMLQSFVTHRPKSRFVIADFDWLPPPLFEPKRSTTLRLSSYAENDPIVTCMNDVDHACYLTSPDLCDILYPTDFKSLAAFIRFCGKDLNVRTWKQADFLLKFGPEEVDETRSFLTKYSPLINDYSNCSVLVATSQLNRQTTDSFVAEQVENENGQMLSKC